MEWVQGVRPEGGRIAILPGSFHPPTVAHYGLALAALERVDQVIFTLPRAFPHKSFEGVGPTERLELTTRLAATNARFAAVLSEGGLFIEMARELRAAVPGLQELFLVCGRDAAERIVSWEYGPGEGIAEQLREYSLLVAERVGRFRPVAELRLFVEHLPVPEDWNDVSSTRVREAIAAGGEWRKLVPAVIQDRVAELYSPSRLDSRNVRSR